MIQPKMIITATFIKYLLSIIFKFYLKFFIYVYVCACLSWCVMAHACSAHRDQEGVLNALELELQAPMSCPVWVLGINPARTTSALNH